MSEPESSKDGKPPDKRTAKMTKGQSIAFLIGALAASPLLFLIPDEWSSEWFDSALVISILGGGGLVGIAVYELFTKGRPGLAMAVLLPALAGVVAIIAVHAGKRPDGAEIVEFGVFRQAATDEAGTSGFGPVQFLNSEDALHLVERTGRVPNTLGIRFGIEFVVTAVFAGGKADISVRVLHPPIKGRTRTQMTESISLGKKFFAGYSIDYDFEQVPGTWTFQIIHDEEILAEKSFEVTDR